MITAHSILTTLSRMTFPEPEWKVVLHLLSLGLVRSDVPLIRITEKGRRSLAESGVAA